MSCYTGTPFFRGFASVFEKRAGISVLDALDAAANLKTIDDITNVTLGKHVFSDKKIGKRSRHGMTLQIDPALLSRLTPEQRKQLYFAVKKMRV